MTDQAPDQELLARLRAADPASSLPHADPDRVARLLEAAMTDTDTRTPETRESGTHGRSPLTWLVAAAAVVLIVAAGAFAMVQRHHDSPPAAGASVTDLRSAPVTGLCMIPSARLLRLQPIAFRGTVQSLTSTTATFRVAHWYAGGPTDLVSVRFVPSGVPETLQARDLEVGGDFLVAAGQGYVRGCGLTGAVSPHLQKLYDSAFG